MSTLLCTVGTSPLVVPEAFHLCPEAPQRVRLFTGTSETMDRHLQGLGSFFDRHPGVRFDITRIDGFSDLESQNEHDTFEEALLRWYLETLGDEGGVLPWICISGGFKSMSAGLQKVAHLFGARRVFHVLASPAPNTLSELDLALADHKVRRIDIAEETGWPTLKALRSADYPLKTLSTPCALTRVVGSPGGELRQRVGELLRGIEVRAAAWDRIGEMPFASLAILPPAKVDWLNQPLDTDVDGSWIRSLPKAELHCHLGGIATHGPALQRVRNAATDSSPVDGAPPPLPNGWPLPPTRVALETYMRLGDATGSTLLGDRGCLTAQCREVWNLLQRDHVAYAEIRCSPANYADRASGRSELDVLHDIRATFADARREAIASGEFAPLVNLIIIVTRRRSGDLSSISRHLALAVTSSGGCGGECDVVGVDLAGFEAEHTRPLYFQSDFTPAHRCGLAITVHAGENDDVESIWQAVYQLSARRLGHALHLLDSPDLLRVVADRKIAVEMCPYANYQIHGFQPMAGSKDAYPLLHYLRSNVQVTVNTDNPGISAASLSDNFLLLPRLCPGITRRDILQLVRNSYEAAFVTPECRQQLLNAAEKEIAALCQ